MTTEADAPTTWARKISASWRKTVDSIFETADMLVAASDELDHGEFTKMIEHDLPFGPRTAQRLMAIARDERLRGKATHGTLLPASWRTLHEMTRLTDAELERALAQGPETRRRDVEAIINARPLPFVRPKTTAAVPRATSPRVVPLFGERASSPIGEEAVAEPACPPEQAPEQGSDDEGKPDEWLEAYNLNFTLVRVTPAACRLAVQMLFDPAERQPEWDAAAFARTVHELGVAVASNPTLRSISDVAREEDASKEDGRKEGAP